MRLAMIRRTLAQDFINKNSVECGNSDLFIAFPMMKFLPTWRNTFYDKAACLVMNWAAKLEVYMEFLYVSAACVDKRARF